MSRPDEHPPFGHPDFYAPISEMLRDAANHPDCHAYSDELLFAADEIERLRAENLYLINCVERTHSSLGEVLKAHDAWQEARRG